VHTRLKLRIRDKVIKFPRTYRLLRATYHGLRTFYSMYSAPVAQYKIQRKSQAPVKKILALALPMKSEPKLSVAEREILKSTTTLDVIVPVFNRGDLAAGLISELQEQIESISELVKVNLICTDDCSDTATATKLKDLCGRYGFTYVKREKNLGFVGNVNAAWEMGDSEFVLLINSDVIVTDGFLERLLDPMTHDPKVGLSTNPTFGMIAGHLESGSNLNALNSYFLSTSATQVSFLDACTAVGYSLVIRRSAINGATLLDPEYGRGYGEDSDLHYRVLDNGYRSVWNLDSAVSHVGSASFDMTDSASNDRALGRKRFLRKWGLRYFAEIDSQNLALEEAIRRRVAGFPNIDVVSTWLVLPTVQGNIGGIQVGRELAIEKTKQDFRTKIVTLDGSEGSVIGDFISVGNVSDLFGKKTSGTVILVGAQSLELLMDEKWVNPALKFVYFAQGPDWLIDPSTLDIYRDSILRVSEVISVSEYIDREMLKFSDKIEVTRHTPSTDYAKFAGLSNQVKDTDFFLIHRDESGKLGWLTILLANFLSKTNSVTVVSNNRPYGLTKEVNLITGLDRKAMLKEFAGARVYIDTSIFEGFGLTPREAALQNTKVLFMDIADGRSELKKYPSHFSTFNFSPSIFRMIESAMEALAKPICAGCDFCKC
jgi:GT2 family glycosyltransferase